MYHTTIIDYYYSILKYHKAITNEFKICSYNDFERNLKLSKDDVILLYNSIYNSIYYCI